MSVFEVIERIKKYPALYLGENSITKLEAFLVGYAAAEQDYGLLENIKPGKQLLPLDWWYFNEFAKIKCNESESTAGWRRMILNVCNFNEAAALDKFYEFFDEFKALKMVVAKKAVLSEENIYYNDSMKHCYCEIAGVAKPCFENPTAVYIAQLSGGSGYICAVEMEEKVETSEEIYQNSEEAEDFIRRHFGKVENWHMIQGGNIDFGKPTSDN